MSKEKGFCDICGTDIEVTMCCGGGSQENPCGCMGQPTEPPICSKECWEVFTQRRSMGENFISYDDALALSKLGFDEPCLAFFSISRELVFGKSTDYLTSREKANYIFGNEKIPNGIILAPLYTQAFDWLRIHHKLWFRPDFPFDDVKAYAGTIHELGMYSSIGEILNQKTAKGAERMAITKMFELIKKKNDEKNRNNG